MKTPGTIHLLRSKSIVVGGRTACGHMFNKRTMIGTGNPEDVSCRQCARTRYIQGVQGGNVDIPKAPPIVIYIGRAITFEYVNYKREHSTRNVVVVEFRYGTTPYHKKPQWLLHAFDTDKAAERTFAMNDISNVRFTVLHHVR